MAVAQPVVTTRDQLGEGILWCPHSQCVWWVDVLSATLHQLFWPHGTHRRHQLPFRRLGSIGPRAGGGLVVATEQGIFGWSVERGVGAQLMAPRWNVATHRLNDGRCDRAGRFWVGSMHDRDFVPEGTLFSLGPEGAVATHLGEVIVPNSIAFSPDDRSFFFADTRRYVIWQFDFDLASGSIRNRRPFVEFGAGPSRPDGSCVDAEGGLWNAAYAGGRVVRYASDGRVDQVVELPASYPTCVCLGGPDLDVLFITSASFPLSAGERAREPLAGGVFALPVSVKGLPEPMVQA
ncbi:MAG: SMP-30/gluconolactonase/LRE family protein [Pseudomonadota bacterium]|jgi:sugar lactone lactonase YvrE